MSHIPISIKPSSSEAYKWAYKFLFSKQQKSIQDKILLSGDCREVNEFMRDVVRMAEYEPTPKENLEWGKEKEVENLPDIPVIDIREIPPRAEI